MRPARFLAAAILPIALLSGQGRLRPPQNVGCDRNQLTAYQGEVTRYSRDSMKVSIQIRTDENTVESVTLNLTGGQTFESRFLWNSDAFQSHHWKELEQQPGKIRPGMRVIAWICEGSGPALLDWRPPAK